MKKSMLFIFCLAMTPLFFLEATWSADPSIKFAYLGKPDPHKAAYTTGVVNLKVFRCA